MIPHEDKRISIYCGDRSDEEILRQIATEVGPPNIVIHDGSHTNLHVIKGFDVLFPRVQAAGGYRPGDRG